MSQKIVILGGGYGGILAAKKIAKKIKKAKLLNDIEVTLIDKNPYHTLLTELHEVAADRVSEESIKVELSKIFAGRNVNVVLDEIKSIDFDNNKLFSDEKEYEYNYLIIGSGCKPTFFGIEGAKENTFTLWSYEDAVRIKHHILEMFRKAEKETDVELRQQMLTFVVAGAGFTGVEMIGELAEWKETLIQKYSINKEEVNLYIVDMLPSILPNLPKKLIKKTEIRLKKMGVEIVTEAPISKVETDCVCLNNMGNIKTNTVIWTTGVEGSDIVSKLNIDKKARNRIITDSKLRSVDYDNVYVVGDNIFYIPEGEERPVPQMVENCENSAPIVANNVIASIKGDREYLDYNPKFHGMMVSIGGRYGVAYVGTHKKKYCLPSFFAMFVKHFINVMYFVQIAGWNKVYSYVMHEIFRVKNRRSFLGGYFSKMSPNFWAVPLRIFVGVQWFLQGWHKVPKILEDPNEIFLFNIPGESDTGSSATLVQDIAEEAADAITAASSTGEAAAAWGDSLPVPEFIQKIVDWSMEYMVAPVAPVFQALMVFAELGIGLALIAGLFTAPISVVSAALCVMIYLSGMASSEILWYFVSSIALIGGSGSTFGLDYYVLPWLKLRWKRIKWVRKLYIYND